METRASLAASSPRHRRREAAPATTIYRDVSVDGAEERGYYDATASHDGERCRALLLRLLRDVAAFARQQQLQLQSEPQPPAPHAALWIHAVARVCDDRVDRLQRCGTHDVASSVLSAAAAASDVVAEAMVQELLVSLLKIRLGEAEALVLDEVENVESLRVLRGELELDEATLRRAVRDGAGDETQLKQLQLLLREAFVAQLAQTRAQGLADALHNESSLQFAWETIQDQKREIQRLRAENETLQTTMAAPSEIPAVPQHAEVNGDMRRSIQQLQLQLSSHPYTRLPLMEAQLSLLEAAMAQQDGSVEESRHTVTTSGATLSLSRDDLDLGESLRGSVLLPSHLTLSSIDTPVRECVQCRRYGRAYVECRADNKRLRAHAAADEDALARAEQAYANLKNEHSALTSALLTAKERQEELRRMVVDVTDEKRQFQTRHEAQQRTSDQLVAQLQRQLRELEQSRERSERERLDSSICQEALGNELQRVKKSMQQLETERGALVDDRQKLQLEVADLKNEASVVTLGAYAATNALADAQRELESTRQRLEAAHTQISMLENAIKGHERACQELSEAEATACRRAGHLQSERDLLADSVQRLRQEIEARKKESAEAAAKAEEKLQSLVIQADRDRHESEQLKLSQATLQEESDLLLDGVRRLKQEVEDLQEEKALQAADDVEAREALAVAERELASVKQTLEATRLTVAQHQSTTENLFETLKERSASESAALQRVEQLRSERDALVASAAELRDEAIDLKAELVRTKTAADETQRALTAAECEVANMKLRSDEALTADQVLPRCEASIGVQSSPSTCAIGVQTLHSMLDEPHTTHSALLGEAQVPHPSKSLDGLIRPQEGASSDSISSPREVVHDIRARDPLITHELDEDTNRGRIRPGKASTTLSGVLTTSRLDCEPSHSNSNPSNHDGNSDVVDLLVVSDDGLLTETPRERQDGCVDIDSRQGGMAVTQKAVDESQYVEQAERVLQPDVYLAIAVSRGCNRGVDEHLVKVPSDLQSPGSINTSITAAMGAEGANASINDASDPCTSSTSSNLGRVSSKWAAIVSKLLLRSARTDLLSIMGRRLHVQSQQTRVHNRWALLVTRLLSWSKVHALQAMLTVTTSELRWSKQHHEAAKQKQDDLRRLVVELTNEKMKTQSLYESQQPEHASRQRQLEELEQALETSVHDCKGAVASRDAFEKELVSVRASVEELRKERDILVHAVDRLRRQRVQSPTKSAVASTTTVGGDDEVLSTTELEVNTRHDHNAQPSLDVSRHDVVKERESTHDRNQRLELETATPREVRSFIELQAAATVAKETRVETLRQQSSRGVQTAVTSLLTRETGVQTDRNGLSAHSTAEKTSRPGRSEHGESTARMDRIETKGSVETVTDDRPRQQLPASDHTAVSTLNVRPPSVPRPGERDVVYDIAGHGTNAAAGANYPHQVNNPRSEEDAASHPRDDVPQSKQAVPVDTRHHQPRLAAISNTFSSYHSVEHHGVQEEGDQLSDGCEDDSEHTSAHSRTARRVHGTSDHESQFEVSQDQCSSDYRENCVDEEPRSESFSLQHDTSSGSVEVPTTGERACVLLNEAGGTTSKDVVMSTVTGVSPASIDELIEVKDSLKEAHSLIAQHQSTITRLEDSLKHQEAAEEAALAKLQELLGECDQSVDSAWRRPSERLAPHDDSDAAITAIGSVVGVFESKSPEQAATHPSLMAAVRGSELVQCIQQLQREMTALKHGLAAAQVSANKTSSVLLTTEHELGGVKQQLEAAIQELKHRGSMIATLTDTVEELSQSKAVACSHVRLLEEKLAQQGKRAASEDMSVQTSIPTRTAGVQTASSAQPTWDGSEHDGPSDTIQAMHRANRGNSSDSDRSEASNAPPGSSDGTTPRLPSQNRVEDIVGSASVSVPATKAPTMDGGEGGGTADVVVFDTDEGASAVPPRTENGNSGSLKAVAPGSELVEHTQQLQQEVAALKNELATSHISASEGSSALLANERELESLKERLEVATRELEHRGATIETLAGTLKELSQSAAAAWSHVQLLEEKLMRQCDRVSRDDASVQTSIATKTVGVQTQPGALSGLLETSHAQPIWGVARERNVTLDGIEALHEADRGSTGGSDQSEAENAPRGSSDGITPRHPLLNCDHVAFGSASVSVLATESKGKHGRAGEMGDFSHVGRVSAIGERTEEDESNSDDHSDRISACHSTTQARYPAQDEDDRNWRGADALDSEEQAFDRAVDQEDVLMSIDAGAVGISGGLQAHRPSNHRVASGTAATLGKIEDALTAHSRAEVRGEPLACVEQGQLSRVLPRSGERPEQSSHVDASELTPVTMLLEAARQEITMYQETVARLTAALNERVAVGAVVFRGVSSVVSDGCEPKAIAGNSPNGMTDTSSSRISLQSAHETAINELAVVTQEASGAIAPHESEAQEMRNERQDRFQDEPSTNRRAVHVQNERQHQVEAAIPLECYMADVPIRTMEETTDRDETREAFVALEHELRSMKLHLEAAQEQIELRESVIQRLKRELRKVVDAEERARAQGERLCDERDALAAKMKVLTRELAKAKTDAEGFTKSLQAEEPCQSNASHVSDGHGIADGSASNECDEATGHREAVLNTGSCGVSSGGRVEVSSMEQSLEAARREISQLRCTVDSLKCELQERSKADATALTHDTHRSNELMEHCAHKMAMEDVPEAVADNTNNGDSTEDVMAIVAGKNVAVERASDVNRGLHESNASYEPTAATDMTPWTSQEHFHHIYDPFERRDVDTIAGCDSKNPVDEETHLPSAFRIHDGDADSFQALSADADEHARAAKGNHGVVHSHNQSLKNANGIQLRPGGLKSFERLEGLAFESSSVDVSSPATSHCHDLSTSEACVVLLQREYNELVEQLQRLELEAATARNDAASTRADLDSAECVVAALKRDLEMAHQEIALHGSSTARLNRVVAEHDELQATAFTQIQQLQNERSVLEVTVGDLTEQLNAARHDAEKTTKALAITVGELESMKQDLEAARQQAAKHESTFVKRKSSLKELSESETTASAHVLQLENERNLLVEKTEQLELKLVEMEEHAITARASAREYHDAMVAAWAELSAAKQSLAVAHQELQRRDDRPKKAVQLVSAPRGVLSSDESLVRRDHATRQIPQRQTSSRDRARSLKRGGPLDEDTTHRSAYASELTIPLHGSQRGLPQVTDRGPKAVSLEIACEPSVGDFDGLQPSQRMHRADLPPQHASDYAYREEGAVGDSTSCCSTPPMATPEQVEDDGAVSLTTAAAVRKGEMRGQIVDHSQSLTIGFERTNEGMIIEGKHVKEEEAPLGCKDPPKPRKQHQHAHTGSRDALGLDKLVTHAKKLGQVVPTTTGSSVDVASEESQYLGKDLNASAALSPSQTSMKRKLQERRRTATVSSELHSVVHECVTLLRRCIKDQSIRVVGDRPKPPPHGEARLKWTQVIDLNRLVWVLVEASKQTEELQVTMATKLEEIKTRDAQLLRLERHCTELRQIVETYHAQRAPRRQDQVVNAPAGQEKDGSKWWLSPDHPVRGAGQSTAADPRLRALEKERRELNQRNVVMLERVIEQLKEANVARRRLHERLQLKTRSLDNAQRYCRGVCVENLLLRAFHAWRLRTLR